MPSLIVRPIIVIVAFFPYLGILIDMAFGEPFLAPVFGSSKEGPL
jgi:hypothetical protein